MEYPTTPEIVLGNIPEVEVPELRVTYDRSSARRFLGQISTPEDISIFIKRTFKEDIELQEQFIVLYLSQSNNIIGYYRHSKGSINATVADIRIILGTALKCAAISMVVSHNHPSGNTSPSRADEQLTQKLKEAASTMDIKLLDHVIVTKDSYYSFADQGMLGLEGVQSLINKNDLFVKQVEMDLEKRKSHYKVSIEKLAASFGID